MPLSSSRAMMRKSATADGREDNETRTPHLPRRASRHGDHGSSGVCKSLKLLVGVREPGSPIHSNELGCRTNQNAALETSQKSPPVSNFVPELLRAVKFVLKCIATLDVYEVEELAHGISPDDADQLAIQILEESCAMREAWGGGPLFAQVAEKCRRNRPADPHPEIGCDLPDFDDPIF